MNYKCVAKRTKSYFIEKDYKMAELLHSFLCQRSSEKEILASFYACANLVSMHFIKLQYLQ